METISIISIITIAFLGSFGHCVGMCGGIVIAYSSTKIKSDWTKKIQAIAHLLYSFGRVTTYTILGALFGLVGGVVTFDNAKKLREVVEYMPMDRLVIETDCPYLTPVPNRGKRNDSFNLPYVVSKIAEIKGISSDEVIDITTANAKSIYGIGMKQI